MREQRKHRSICNFQTWLVTLIIYICMPQELLSQEIAMKSNVLYDLTTTLNLGGEIRCSKRRTIHLSLNYNPWGIRQQQKNETLSDTAGIQMVVRKRFHGQLHWRTSTFRPIQLWWYDSIHYSERESLSRTPFRDWSYL